MNSMKRVYGKIPTGFLLDNLFAVKAERSLIVFTLFLLFLLLQFISVLPMRSLLWEFSPDGTCASSAGSWAADVFDATCRANPADQISSFFFSLNGVQQYYTRLQAGHWVLTYLCSCELARVLASLPILPLCACTAFTDGASKTTQLSVAMQSKVGEHALPHLERR